MGSSLPPGNHVLVVDDSDVDREQIRRLLMPDYSVLEATTGSEGLDLCRTQVVDCVLLDYRLPDLDGIAVLDQLLERELAVLMLTGHGSESVAVEAMKRGALDYLVKGELVRERLHRAVRNALDKVALRRQLARQETALRATVGELDAQRQRLEEANSRLAESEARLRVVLEQLPALAWTTDDRLRITSLGGAGLTSVARPALGGPISELVRGDANPDAVRAHAQAIGGKPAQFQLELQSRFYDAHVEPLRTDGSVRGVIGVALDVTRSRALEHQLRQSQKMEALGQLASGVAHDLNNVLTAIMSFGQFVKDAIKPTDPAHGDIVEVLRSASSAGDLVRQLLAFSRQKPIEPKIVDVGELTAGMLPMLRRLLGEDLELELHRGQEPYSAFVDAAGVQQVIVNLVINARDAMPHGGKVTIELSEITVEEASEPSAVRPMRPGEYVLLSVRDSGTGIPVAIVDRIFEPFFTTKAQGKGTGLGLSTCYGIVQQAGGEISVASAVGKGATFSVYLPRRAERMEG